MVHDNLESIVHDRKPVNRPMIVESDLQLKEYLSRPVLLTTLATTGLVPQLNLFQLWKNIVIKKLAGYKYIRGCTKITLQYSGNPVAYGTSLVAFYPTVSNSSSTISTSDAPPIYFSDGESGGITSWYQLPHIQLNWEEFATNEICLPFPDNNGAIEIASGALWWLNLKIINPFTLNSNLTPTLPTVDVYMSMDDVELFGPIQAQGKAQEVNDRWLSRSLKYTTDLLSGISTVEPMMTPFVAMGKFATNLAENMGFSRPMMPAQDVMVMRRQTSLAYVSGQPDFSEKIALDPRISLDVSGCKIPMSSNSDTNVQYLTNQYDPIEVNVTGLTDITVSPTYCMQRASNPNIFEPTRLAFVSMLFLRWRGSIDYKIEFVANSLLRQRFAIIIVPPGQVAPTSYNPGSTLMKTLVNVCGRTVVEINVPYFYKENYRYVAGFFQGLDSNQTRLVILPIDNVQGQSGTVVPLKYNLFIKAGHDFELAQPHLNNVNEYVPVDNVDNFRIQPQGKMNVSVFGEDVKDLLLLTRRPVQLFSFSPLPQNVYMWNMFGPVPGQLSIGITDPSADLVPFTLPRPVEQTYLSWIGCAYYGITGGIRYKTVTNNINARFTGTVDFGLCGASDFSTSTYTRPAGRGIAYMDAVVGEFEIPSQVLEDFTFGPRLFTSTQYQKSSDNFVLTLITPTSGDTLRVLQSGADDLVIRGFLCVPPMRSVIVQAARTDTTVKNKAEAMPLYKSKPVEEDRESKSSNGELGTELGEKS